MLHLLIRKKSFAESWLPSLSSTLPISFCSSLLVALWASTRNGGLVCWFTPEPTFKCDLSPYLLVSVWSGMWLLLNNEHDHYMSITTTVQSFLLWVNQWVMTDPPQQSSPRFLSKRRFAFDFPRRANTIWQQHSFVVCVHTRSNPVLFSHGFILGSLLAQCCKPVLHRIIGSTTKKQESNISPDWFSNFVFTIKALFVFSISTFLRPLLQSQSTCSQTISVPKKPNTHTHKIRHKLYNLFIFM